LRKGVAINRKVFRKNVICFGFWLPATGPASGFRFWLPATASGFQLPAFGLWLLLLATGFSFAFGGFFQPPASSFRFQFPAIGCSLLDAATTIWLCARIITAEK
jgi:hypothetical protein